MHELACRLAPSLITRSESEYLGLSSPRFAARIYVEIGGEEVAFLNLRRLADLEAAIRRRFGIAASVPLPRELRNAVADSLLSVPPQLTYEYHCLTSEMAGVYNEESPGRGTPYVSQLEWLGGGVCAECAAATSVQLLFEYCECVHGVAEVKSLSNSDPVDMLDSGGMYPESLVRYLRRQPPGPGLWGAVLTTERPATKALGRDFRIESRDLSWALRCYVASGIPVILPVDLSRMNGGFLGIEDYSNTQRKDILTKNNAPASIAIDGWPTHDNGDDTEDGIALRVREHMVVVAGIGKSGTTSLRPANDERFVIHDSATLPFLRASGQDLFDVVSGDDRERVLLPVTPAKAQVPLLPVESADSVRSVSEVAYWLQRCDESSPYYVDYEYHFDIGTFRLVDLSTWDSSQSYEDLPPNFYCDSEDFPSLIVRELLSNASQIKEAAGATSAPCFVWLQYHSALPGIGRCVHVWSAQLSEDDNSRLFTSFSGGLNGLGEAQLTRDERDELFAELQLKRFAIGRLIEGADGTYIFQAYDGFEPQEDTNCATGAATNCCDRLSQQEKASIQLAVINSFDPTGAFGGGWPQPEVACEYYAFMEPTIEKWKNSGILGNASVSTAVDLLGLISRDDSLCGSVAKHVLNEVPVEILSLASFFQEHSDAPGSSRSVLGVRALEGLIRLGCEMKSLGSKVSTIEIVCGNRLADVQVPVSLASVAGAKLPLILPSEITVVAPVRSRFVAIDFLLKNLEEALSGTGDLLRNSGLRIVLELEPGQLFTNSSFDAIRRIVERIEKSPHLKDCVFLNLDCSHALQAGISPVDLMRNSRVLQRFSHVHVSGCDRRGHFGDTDQVSFHGFEDVVRCMVRNAARHGKSLTISVEMEAARTIGTVRRAIQSAKNAVDSL